MSFKDRDDNTIDLAALKERKHEKVLDQEIIDLIMV